jgi:hypothetical protein
LLDKARDRLAGLPLTAAEKAAAAHALCAILRRLGHVVAHQFEIALQIRKHVWRASKAAP